jgi:hypothetical protein
MLSAPIMTRLGTGNSRHAVGFAPGVEGAGGPEGTGGTPGTGGPGTGSIGGTLAGTLPVDWPVLTAVDPACIISSTAFLRRTLLR